MRCSWSRIFRAGTGSAMYCVKHDNCLPATSDGMDSGSAFPANFSSWIFIKDIGPFSAAHGFVLPALSNAMNGDPLKMEFHHTVFDDSGDVRKVANFMRGFIVERWHQLQINSVNGANTKDAQIYPENHKDLIVRARAGADILLNLIYNMLKFWRITILRERNTLWQAKVQNNIKITVARKRAQEDSRRSCGKKQYKARHQPDSAVTSSLKMRPRFVKQV